MKKKLEKFEKLEVKKEFKARKPRYKSVGPGMEPKPRLVEDL